MSRKIARELAFKVIFSFDFQKEDSEIESLIKSLENESEELTIEDKDYVKDVVNGVITNRENLDEKIQKYLKGWTMDRISKTDLAILRLSTYEIIYRDDIPYKVSINEALELAKSFSDSTSPSFINGVLAEIIGEV